MKKLKWTFRWYGDNDPIILDHIRQIPNMHGVVGTLVKKLPGDLWTKEEILELKNAVEAKGLTLAGIESVSIHDSIKAGTPERDHYIEVYKENIKNLGELGVNVICYSFKPMYKGITEEKLFENLCYFLERVIPVCEQYGVKMAIHPDDPPFDMFGLPRITKNKEDILKIVNAVDSDYNGVTLCTGSLGANPENDLVDIIHSLKGKIHFAHLRNVQILGDKHFLESAHLSKEGSLDMYAIVKALHDIGFDGIARPDHGRTIWGEVARPGYGLYDRAIGISYLQGLEEAVEKQN